MAAAIPEILEMHQLVLLASAALGAAEITVLVFGKEVDAFSLDYAWALNRIYNSGKWLNRVAI